MATNQKKLNRMNPAAKDSGLGDDLKAIIDRINVLSIDALLVKGTLLLAAGVGKEKYVVTQLLELGEWETIRAWPGRHD